MRVFGVNCIWTCLAFDCFWLIRPFEDLPGLLILNQARGEDSSSPCLQNNTINHHKWPPSSSLLQLKTGPLALMLILSVEFKTETSIKALYEVNQNNEVITGLRENNLSSQASSQVSFESRIARSLSKHHQLPQVAAQQHTLAKPRSSSHSNSKQTITFKSGLLGKPLRCEMLHMLPVKKDFAKTYLMTSSWNV